MIITKQSLPRRTFLRGVGVLVDVEGGIQRKGERAAREPNAQYVRDYSPLCLRSGDINCLPLPAATLLRSVRSAKSFGAYTKLFQV